MNLTLKDYPTLAKAIKKAMPRYRKHKVSVVQANRITPYGGYWDGGSIDYWNAYSLYGEFLCHVPTPSAPPQFGGGKPQPFDIPDHMMVIKSGVFCGKPSYLTIYLQSPEVFDIKDGEIPIIFSY